MVTPTKLTDKQLEWYGSELDPTHEPDISPAQWMIWIIPTVVALSVATALFLGVYLD